MSDDGKVLNLKPKVVAHVSIRREEVLVVEDLMGDNPHYSFVNNEPRKRINGCMALMSGGPHKVRMNQTREEVLAKIDPDGTLFVHFDHQDPDGRRSG